MLFLSNLVNNFSSVSKIESLELSLIQVTFPRKLKRKQKQNNKNQIKKPLPISNIKKQNNKQTYRCWMN